MGHLLFNSILVTSLPPRWIFAALAIFVSVQSGCGSVHRRILVRSNPEGALVTIDHQPIGHAPVSVPFTYWGTRQIELEKDGYETIKVKQKFSPPWYQIPPLDFVSENLWPRPIRDDRLLDFQMIPLSTVNENQLKDRANQLRGNVLRGTVPMPTAMDQRGQTRSAAERSPVISR